MHKKVCVYYLLRLQSFSSGGGLRNDDGNGIDNATNQRFEWLNKEK